MPYHKQVGGEPASESVTLSVLDKRLILRTGIPTSDFGIQDWI